MKTYTNAEKIVWLEKKIAGMQKAIARLKEESVPKPSVDLTGLDDDSLKKVKTLIDDILNLERNKSKGA